MDPITPKDLDTLIRPRRGPCVTLYAPMVRAGPEVRQNRIRWKNLVADALRALETRNGATDPEALLEPAARLIEDAEYWQIQADGLACFLDADGASTWRLPRAFSEAAHVLDDLFVLRPLLPLLENDGAFRVLALSANEVRLYSATRQTIREVALDDVPRSLEEARRLDDPEATLQHHTAEPGAAGERPAATWHGQGLPADHDEKRLRRFLEQLWAELRKRLGGDRSPFVVAAVGEVRAAWARVCDHPGLVEPGLAGNPEEWDADELHRRAWRLVEPGFRRRLERDADVLRRLRSTDRGGDDPESIVRAAREGRVESLFVDRDGEADELLDRAVAETLGKDGRVHAVGEGEAPGGTPAAIFRW